MCRESLIDFSKYKVSEDGTIFSKFTNKKLKGTYCNGYIQIVLKCIDSKQRHFYWHRVIYFYFKGDIPQGMEINHIDENKLNNTISNLNLMTHKENNNWGTHNERSAKANTNHQKTSKKVYQYTLDGTLIKEWPSTRECERKGFDHSSVYKCCLGKPNYNTYKGYLWSYIPM